jgi:hypothetical protein
VVWLVEILDSVFLLVALVALSSIAGVWKHFDSENIVAAIIVIGTILFSLYPLFRAK